MTPLGRWVHAVLVSIFRRLQRVLPPEYRRRHAEEMASTFAARLRTETDGRLGRMIVLFARDGADVVRSGVRLRRRLARIRNASSSHRTPHMRGIELMSDLIKDLRFAARILARNPLFAVVSAVTLALGVGAVTAIFSVVQGVLLDPLPFPEPNELALIWTENEEQEQERYFVSPMEFQDWMERNRSFEDVASYWPNSLTLSDSDGTVFLARSSLTSWNLFSTLGLEPHLGRFFVPEDGAPGAATVAVLSYELWASRYGSDPDVVGDLVDAGGVPVPVIGVTPPGAAFPEGIDVWTNINFPWQIQSRAARWMSVVGRLQDGVTVEQAQAEMNTLAGRLEEENPSWNVGWGIEVGSLKEFVVGDIRPVLLILLGVTGLVLLIACANVANLLLSRAEARGEEIGVRVTLGAGRMRLARQLLTESFLLSLLGVVGGLVVAFLGSRVLLSLAPPEIPRLDEVALDGTVLLVALGVSLITGLIFGLAPIAHILRSSPAQAVRDGGRSGAGHSRIRLQHGFVVAELGLAMVVIVGAGLLVRSFTNLKSVDPGFSSGGLVTFETDLAQTPYPTDEEVRQFYITLEERLAQIPGVTQAGVTSSLPFMDANDYFQTVILPDQPQEPGAADTRAYLRQVSPAFFDAMSIELVEGRFLDDTDRLESAGVAVVNESMANLYWPDESPVGKTIANTSYRMGPLGVIFPSQVEVVGVVRDLKYADLRSGSEPSIYFTSRQAPFRKMTAVLRTSAEPGQILSEARATVAGLDATLPITNALTMDQIVSSALARDRFGVVLLGLFGGLALVLSAVGVYGLLSYGVQQRRREIGIRMALGAAGRDVLRFVIGDGFRLVLLGLPLGILGALFLTGPLSGQLFEVNARDPFVLGTMALFLTGVALLASYVPAKRATRTDPIRSLRNE